MPSSNYNLLLGNSLELEAKEASPGSAALPAKAVPSQQRQDASSQMEALPVNVLTGASCKANGYMIDA